MNVKANKTSKNTTLTVISQEPNFKNILIFVPKILLGCALSLPYNIDFRYAKTILRFSKVKIRK